MDASVMSSLGLFSRFGSLIFCRIRLHRSPLAKKCIIFPVNTGYSGRRGRKWYRFSRKHRLDRSQRPEMGIDFPVNTGYIGHRWRERV